MNVDTIKKRPVVLAVTLALVSWQGVTRAQNQDVEDAAIAEPAIEEVVVLGRAISATQELINERLTDANVIDTLGAETIFAPRRLHRWCSPAPAARPHVGQRQVLYIRGLGERYSASLVNGANLPSPDLTRNVIPLDIFPTSIVESLRVQKAWSAELPANFGGGNVDIRTRGIPDGFVFNFELGTGYNDLNSDDGLTYTGGSDDKFGTDDGTRALSQNLLSTIARFQGQVADQDIFAFLQRENPDATIEEARLVNRQLGAELTARWVERDKSLPLDLDAKVSVGNNWLLGNDWEFGGARGW